MDSNKVAPGNDIVLGYSNPSVAGCENGCINDYSTLLYDVPQLDVQQNIDFVSFSNGIYSSLFCIEYQYHIPSNWFLL